MMSRQSGNRRGYSHLRDMIHPDDPTNIVLNKDTDDELHCWGYCPSRCGKAIHFSLCIITCGLWLLVAYWKPEWKLTLTYSSCRMSKATHVLLNDYYKQHFVLDVNISPVDSGQYLEYTSKNLCEEEELMVDNDSCDDDTAILTSPFTEKWYLRYFDFQHIRYIWKPENCTFIRLCGLESGIQCYQLHQQYKGYNRELQSSKQFLYGMNTISIDVQSYPALFVTEVLNPFYIFQVVSVALWMSDEYYYYAACIIIISLISITISLREIRRQSVTLRDMVSSVEANITVCRGHSDFEDVPTTDLVPGDVIVIPSSGCVMNCDAVLITGNCIVNESMLTGESVPVTKTPLMQQEDDEEYSPDVHKRHTLFSGTHVIQTRYYGQAKVTAVVIQTGFSTAKGNLVRSILFPKPIDFKFYADAIKFIMVMAGIASIGMGATLYIMLKYDVKPFKIFLRVMDIITIVVPPALPAAMTVGTVYAQGRLRKRGIFCISPPRINMCALLDVVCFDKTGTLTEDGLDLLGVVPLQGRRFLHSIQDTSELPRGPFLAAMATCHSLTRISGQLSGDPLDLKMFLSTNWKLDEPAEDTTRFDSLIPTIVRPSTNDSVFLDDNSGAKILEETGRETTHFDCMMPTIVRPCTRDTYASCHQTPYEIGIVRQFTFSSALQRMSVITRTLAEDHMDLYCKGAPEKIMSLCLPSSVPEDFHEVLQRYTLQGFRVIALAWKSLNHKLAWHQAQKIHRSEVECELKFLGFLIMQNTLKPETTPIINQLQTANIRTVMVTGDNMLTAVSVARECRMIQPIERVIMVNAVPPDGNYPAKITWEYADVVESDTGQETDYSQTSYQSISINHLENRYHFAISGKSFAIVKQFFPELMQKLCVRGSVFARMSPDQKSQLVEELQEISYTVGMCGDGANDCGALKTAHAGISLSESEASVASPFTSSTPHIGCVPIVIREGRAALVTSFGVFKYMAMYSMIQFISVIILYSIESNLGDEQFLYLDLVVTTTVAFLMGHTSAFKHLDKKPPQPSLLSFPVLLSIFLQVTVQLGCQLGVFLYIQKQPWLLPFKSSYNNDNIVASYEGTLMFCYSAFQYLICALCFSKGPPYRKRTWTNVPFLVSLILLTVLTAFLWLHPFKFVREFFRMMYFPDKLLLFKIIILLVVLGNFMLSTFIEEFVIDSWLLHAVKKILKSNQPYNKVYKQIEEQLKAMPEWPPVGDLTFSTSGAPLTHFDDVSMVVN